MLILAILIAMFSGVAGGALIMWGLLPRRYKQHIDYKQRWQDAIRLLAEQGQLSEDQVRRISGNASPVAPPGEVQPASLRTLHSLATWDRKELEISRAREGLPPVDDLKGMASWDITAVLKARAKYSPKNP